jgi:hypothetical protein
VTELEEAIVAVLLALLFFFTTVLVLLLAQLACRARCSYRIHRGQYAAARAELEAILCRPPSLLRCHRETRWFAAFHLAVCDLEEGRAPEAIARLRALESRRAHQRDVVDVTLGAALLVSGGDPTEARERLERVVPRRPTVNVVLLLSHAILAEGDEEGARAMLATATADACDTSPSLVWQGLVRFDGPRRRAATEAFLRGWYAWYFSQSKNAEARPILEEAALGPPDRISVAFARKASALLSA